ncbi:MAG: succinate dehydrogenase assembly factor 2 [bacterium]|jgi:antitoxin CptB
MSGTTLPSAALDPRRKRVLFRAWHRGMREMDLILGAFCDAEIAACSEADLDALEALLDVPDQDVYAWLTGSAPVPAPYDQPVFHRLRAFHTHATPRFA